MPLGKITVVKPYPSVGFTVCCMHLNFFKRPERLPRLEEGSWGGKFTINKQHSVQNINQNLQNFLQMQFFKKAFHILSGKLIFSLCFYQVNFINSLV